jgi:flagellar basal body-associated protein FliL
VARPAELEAGVTDTDEEPWKQLGRIIIIIIIIIIIHLLGLGLVVAMVAMVGQQG